MQKTLKALILLVILLFSNALADSAIPFQENYEAIDRAAKSCFLVKIIGEKGNVIGTGSGFVAFDEHVFITNHHVIDDSTSIQIYSDQYQSTHTLTELIAANEELDIAILAFPEGDQYEALALDPEFDILRGQPVTAIGSPEGVLNTVSSGNISSIIKYNDGTFDLQFTAPISHGSSGGALFNGAGDVIALVYATHSEGENMNYAVPIEYVINLYNSKINTPTISLSRFNFKEQYITPPEKVSVFINDNGKPQITWSIVEGADDYRVYRIDKMGNEKLIATRKVSADKSSGTIWDAKPLYGQTVSYYVIARNNVKSSEKSEYAEIAIPPKPTPTPSKVPTPSPTPRPTPTPTATPQLPDGISSSYTPGASGRDIIVIKQRMQELGYYTSNASLGNSYNNTMEERIKLFQSENKLPITGILDNKTLQTLFSSSAKSAKTLNPTKAPKPTPKKTSEPRITLIIPDNSYGQWNYSDNYIDFRIQVENVSKTKSISAFELYIYPVDIWGNRMIDSNKVYTQTTTKTIKPGKTTYSDYITLPDAKEIAQIYVAIHRVKYSDGTIEETYPTTSSYSYWDID